jgi:hypothetical protein
MAEFQVIERRLGKSGEGEELLKKEIQTKKTELGAGNVRTLEAMERLALLYCESQRYREEEALLNEILAARTKTNTTGDDLLRTILRGTKTANPHDVIFISRLALNKCHLGHFKEEKSLLDQEHSLLNKSDMKVSELDRSQFAYNLAYDYMNIEDYGPAAAIADEGYHLAEKYHGPQQREMLFNCASLAAKANLYANDSKTSRERLTQALDIAPQDSLRKQTVSEYACILDALKRKDEAAELRGQYNIAK